MIFTAFKSGTESSVTLVFISLLCFIKRVLICARDKAVVNITVPATFSNFHMYKNVPGDFGDQFYSKDARMLTFHIYFTFHIYIPYILPFHIYIPHILHIPYILPSQHILIQNCNYNHYM